MDTYVKVKAQLINRNGVFAGVVLHHSSKEGLSEIESGHPEHMGLTVFVPSLRGLKWGLKLGVYNGV